MHPSLQRSTSVVLLRLICCISLVSLLAACGEPGATLGTPGGEPISATGSVSVFITEAPSDDFDRILVTIDKIQLLGDGGPVTIFTGEETIDLKELENFSDLFVYASEVPTGRFNKIRLGVARIQLVREGADAEVIEVDPPASGKIDLLPKGQFEVRRGVTLVIEIDFDAKKSIHIVGTGSGKYKFRPIIFVTIQQTRAPFRLARVHGEIVKIFDDESFELCSTVFMASRDVVAPTSAGHEGGIGDQHRCMLVEYDAETGVFDSNGDPAVAGSLEVKDEVTAVGRFHLVDDNHDDPVATPVTSGDGLFAGAADSLELSSRHFERHERSKHDKPGEGQGDTDADTDSDSDGGSGSRPPQRKVVLVAFVIEQGPLGNFLELRGMIESELEEFDEFDFRVWPGQGFGDRTTVLRSLLQVGTRIFTKRGREVGDTEILPETLAKIDGILLVDRESIYKTALLILDIDDPVLDELRGEIGSIDEDQRRLRVDPDDPAAPNMCVFVPEDSRIHLIDKRGDPDVTREAVFSDLEVGMRVETYGKYDFDLVCFVARTVLAIVPDIGPVECNANDDCVLDEFCNTNELSCDAIGFCDRAPEACPQVYDPVCGCDGNTYGNACEANADGVSVASLGECEAAGGNL